MSIENKYIAYFIDGDIILLSIKELIVNRSICLVPQEENENNDAGPFFLTKVIPNEIIGILCEDRLVRAKFKETSDFFKEFNEKTGYYIENDVLKFRQYIVDRRTTTSEKKIYNESITEHSIVITVDSNNDSDLFMEFESADCAKLYVETAKNEWEARYGD